MPTPPPIPRSRLAAYAAVITLAALASFPSLGNGFALDDLPIVADNPAVHSLDHLFRLFGLPYWPPRFGVSLYRPVLTSAFALQWSVANGAPWVFHATNIILYAALSAVVLGLLRQLLPPAAAFAAGALFAVHPVHVEAVGNVVGQGELITSIAAVAAVVSYIQGRRNGRISVTRVTLIGTLFAVACFCKEHGLLLPALLVAVELLVIRDDAHQPIPLTRRVRDTAGLFTTLAAIGAGYVLARTAVVGGVLGERHLVPIFGLRRVWVMLAVTPHWVRLLAWPAHLSADYSPPQIALPEGPGLEVMLGAIVIAVTAIAFVALGRGDATSQRERAGARLGIASLAITMLPVTNLFSVMVIAERTLLLPSVGAMVIVGAIAAAALRRASSTRHADLTKLSLATATAVLLTLGAVRSRSRQLVWRDDATLFAQTVEDAPRSYRAQFLYGEMLFEQGKRGEGERRLRLAIALNPTPSDVSPLNYLATEYRDAGMCAQALPLYRNAIANDPARPDVRYGLAECLRATGRRDEARHLAAEGSQRGDLRTLFDGLLARIDSTTAAHSH
ncbi:MAG TPA: tetratricopeptide repeat protein [Gemmatimonadaceae bacterium]|nr:tetratricopeptide repeat protein [Gemmatimonadaceae bacterium]